MGVKFLLFVCVYVYSLVCVCAGNEKGLDSVMMHVCGEGSDKNLLIIHLLTSKSYINVLK